MGRLFLIDYDQTHETKFYICRTCHAHISLATNLLFNCKLCNKIYFGDAVNLVVDGPEHYRRVGGVMEADVNCTKCLGYLGWDLYVEDHENEPVASKYAGTILLMDKLLVWNGEEVADANTEDEIPRVIIDQV